MTFGGDMRKRTISYKKILHALDLLTRLTPDDVKSNVLHSFHMSPTNNTHSQGYQNTQFIANSTPPTIS